MNSYKIRFLPRARENIIDIGDYISFSLFEPDTSKCFIKNLKYSISTLRQFPYRYPIMNPNDNRTDIRCMPYKNYYVFYSVDEATMSINILRIGYNKRNWSRILRL